MSFSQTEIVTTHNIKEVANFVKKSVSTVYSDLTRRPDSLPPRLHIPGGSKVLFVNLHLWAAGLMQQPANVTPTPATPALKKKRGRPSNISKQKAAAGRTK